MSNIKIPAWSFSSIKTFDQCPKKYYHLKVAKDFQEDQNAEHLIYGTRFHEAAEFYIRDDKPLPHEFNYAKATLDRLKAFPGEKLCEYEMGLTENLEPCGFKDPNVWWRGIADLIVLRDDVAFVLDYKTGKSAKYADTKQLKLLAAAVFTHYPEIRVIKAGLLFVVSKDFIKEEYDCHFRLAYFEQFRPLVQQLEDCHNNGVWNPKRNFSCKAWCPVLSCAHNGKN